MAITQISRIQIRRGLSQDLPTLSSGEFGWSTDTNELWIGNGTASEGAPLPGGRTQIMTTGGSANIAAIQSNVAGLQSNVASIQGQLGSTVSVALSAASSGQLTTVTSNNATINYTLTQGSVQRSGAIHLSRLASGSTIAYDEDYNQTAATDIVFSANANSTQANLYYTTTTATNMLYQINTVR